MAPPPPPSFHDDLSDSQRMPLLAVARNLSFKIPVWPILLLLCGGMYTATRMYFQVEQLNLTIAAVNESLRGVSTQLAEITKAQTLAASEITALRDRVSRVEMEHARLLAGRHER